MPAASWPGIDRQLVGAEAALLQEEIGAADAARLDADARLARAGLGVGTLDELERCADGRQERGSHAVALSMPRNRAHAAAAAGERARRRRGVVVRAEATPVGPAVEPAVEAKAGIRSSGRRECRGR